jgi:hypothetical protein
MFNSYGCSPNVKYSNYSSKDAELNISMDYISGWTYIESRGSYGSYAQVQFIGPEIKGKDFRASMIVTVKKESKVDFKPLIVEAMIDDIVTRRLKFKDAQVLSKSKIKLSGIDAVDIALTYKELDRLRSIDAKFVPRKERLVIFKKGDKFYILRYVHSEEDFAKFDKAFYHCVKTLKFKG